MSDLLLDLGLDSTPQPADQATATAAPTTASAADDFLAELAGTSSSEVTAVPNTQPRLEILDTSPLAPGETPAPSAGSTAGNPGVVPSSPEVTLPPTPTTPNVTQEQEQQHQSAQSSETTAPSEASEKKEEDTKPGIVALDPTHKEILDKYGGRWRMVRSDPYDEYLKVVGVGLFNRKIAGKGTPDLTLQVKDKDIFMSLKSRFHSQNYRLRLDEEVENLVEKAMQSVVTSYQDGKLILNMSPVAVGFDKVQEVELSVSETGEGVLIYTAGSAVCRRYFMKMPEVGITLPSMTPPVTPPETPTETPAETPAETPTESPTETPAEQ